MGLAVAISRPTVVLIDQVSQYLTMGLDHPWPDCSTIHVIRYRTKVWNAAPDWIFCQQNYSFFRCCNLFPAINLLNRSYLPEKRLILHAF